MYLARMNAFMLLQVVFATKCFAACLAVVRLLSGVRAQMCAQMTRTRKGFLAMVAPGMESENELTNHLFIRGNDHQNHKQYCTVQR